MNLSLLVDGNGVCFRYP